jgi:hypothetical protein
MKEYPFLSFELNVEAIYRTRNEFTTGDHQTIYGQPLWRLYFSASYRELQRFAIFKLLGGNSRFRPRGSNYVAAIASRVSLDLCQNELGAELARTTVDSHLRLLLAVDQLSGMVKAATPSEPHSIGSGKL